MVLFTKEYLTVLKLYGDLQRIGKMDSVQIVALKSKIFRDKRVINTPVFMIIIMTMVMMY